MTHKSRKVRLLLGERPRLEIPLSSGESEQLPAWLVVEIPGPQAEPRPEGRFLVDACLPELAVQLAWSQILRVPRTLQVLTITLETQSWTLEQDPQHPNRWHEQADPDRQRTWS